METFDEILESKIKSDDLIWRVNKLRRHSEYLQRHVQRSLNRILLLLMKVSIQMF